MTKPARGNPKTPDQIAAVATMEAEVVRRAAEGQSFYRIERELGITNAGRIFKRVTGSMERSRENAYTLESMRLDTLTEKAYDALATDGLDSLSYRVAEILTDRGEDWEGVPERVKAVIEQAYADTYRGIPVALAVHDRRAKLDGLTHEARIADAHLALDQQTAAVWAGALVAALAPTALSVEEKRAVLERWGEAVAEHEEA